jgi:peptidoglycan/xylan/chitin deacetylase (PgdA/CDA1 family)
VERRQFLSLLAAGVATAGLGVAAAELGPRMFGGAGLLSGTGGLPGDSVNGVSMHDLAEYAKLTAQPELPDAPLPVFFDPQLVKVKVPGGTISAIKGNKGMLALTVDDGVSSVVVREYANFAKRTGMRLTFFVTGRYPAWTDNAALLRPLVDTGQIQLANHTWTHPTLTKLTDGQVASELSLTHDFLRNMYGIDAHPYFRPPFGTHDSRVDRVAAGLGYTTPVLWDGSLSDSGLITTDQVKQFATKYLTAERIVIGHANYTPVTECFDYIRDVIKSRSITPVTLNDLYTRP